jgi:hypothetical protein
VLLHDGQVIVVERTQTVDKGGNREIGQGAQQSEEALAFEMPNSGRTIRWRSDFGSGYEDNLAPLVLDVVEGAPYLVAYPTRCHAYNKWGRPNPPYVFFRFDDSVWERIVIAEVPESLKEANLVIGGYLSRGRQLTDADRRAEYVPTESIRRVNLQMSPDTWYLRQIAHEPIKGMGSRPGCGEMIYDGRGGWVGMGWFRDQPTYKACVKYCERNQIGVEYCPCDDLFKGGK